MFEREIQVLKALANGVNYFTGEQCDKDCILNDVNIIRTLYEVCTLLKDIPTDKTKKSDFTCPFDINEKFEFEEELSLTRIIDKIANLYPTLKKIKHTLLTEILIQKGLLTRVADEEGKNKTVATEQAAQLGIYNKTKTTMYGQEYQVVMYNKEGQQLVLSILKEL